MLFNIAEYAVERRCINANPVSTVKWKAPKSSGEIDRRSVVNPVEATPHAGAEWTNSGQQRDRWQLKNRERGENRPVPVPPELTELLHRHMAEFGTGPDGRLFPGERSEELPKLTYMRAWRAARRIAFVPEIAAGPLAATPYALRHACVSTWLNGGVPAPQVAQWAGHSVDVLLKVYAKCIDGGDVIARRRVMQALGHSDGS
ncbi:hypothetical protein ACQPWY_30875 [Pseudonocardia xinjiangensis]|uniref:hypothetical protein n=1 Tax=Pseudonocardia xinjiangensis TaxID=75289 RepID=UPI003D91718A